MLPNPLHPAIVHFPIVLMFLLPVAAAGALWAIGRGSASRPAWLVPCAFAAALTLSAWVAVETGESQEEKVESAVSETALHTHADAAEQFLLLSGVLLLVTGAGLLGGRAGRTARLAALAGALGLVAVGARVGHTGGKLVYQYGAASAYVQGGPGGGDAAAAEGGRETEAD